MKKFVVKGRRGMQVLNVQVVESTPSTRVINIQTEDGKMHKNIFLIQGHYGWEAIPNGTRKMQYHIWAEHLLNSYSL